jgi:hypothetical protein
MEPVKDLSALGRQVVHDLRAYGPTAVEHALLRERIARASRRRPRWHAPRVAAAAVFVGALLIIGLWVIKWPAGAALRFTSGATAGRVGDFLSATAEPLPIRFSDGTSVVFSPGTKGRVASVSAFGADVVIEAGRADIHVVPRSGNKWSVHTGPYVVLVTGTRFTVAWDVTKNAFSLELREGSVTVVGGVFRDGTHVAAGERVDATNEPSGYTVSLLSDAVEDRARHDSAPTNDGRAAGDNARTEPSRSAKEEPPLSRAPVSAAVPKAPTDWRVLARRGRYAEAFRAAEAEGFVAQLEQGSPAELLLLGDAARLAGHRDAARAAYRALRDRSPGSPSAATAAFYLGRIDADQASQLSNAERWLEIYLAESPNGDMAAAALGRLIELHVARNETRDAETVAREYLRRFPDGAHSAAATRVLSPTGSR